MYNKKNVAVLPLARDMVSGDIYVYLPIERKKWVGQQVVDCLTTFGGGVGTDEETTDAATRELDEESLGIYGSAKHIKNKLKQPQVKLGVYTEDRHNYDLRYQDLKTKTDIFLMPVADGINILANQDDYFLNAFRARRAKAELVAERSEVQRIARIKLSDLQRFLADAPDDNQTIPGIDSNGNVIQLPFVSYVFKSLKHLNNIQTLVGLEQNFGPLSDIQTLYAEIKSLSKLIANKDKYRQQHDLDAREQLEIEVYLQQSRIMEHNLKLKLQRDILKQNAILQEAKVSLEMKIRIGRAKIEAINLNLSDTRLDPEVAAILKLSLKKNTVLLEETIVQHVAVATQLGISETDTNALRAQRPVEQQNNLEQLQHRLKFVQKRINQDQANIAKQTAGVICGLIPHDNSLRSYYQGSMQRRQIEKASIEQQIRQAMNNAADPDQQSAPQHAQQQSEIAKLQNKLESFQMRIDEAQANLLKQDIDDTLRTYYQGALRRNEDAKQNIEQQIRQYHEDMAEPVQQSMQQQTELEMLQHQLDGIKKRINEAQITLAQQGIDDALRDYYQGALRRNEAAKQNIEQQIRQHQGHPTITASVQQRANGALVYQQELAAINDTLKKLRLIHIPDLDKQIENLRAELDGRLLTNGRLAAAREKLEKLKQTKITLNNNFQRLKRQQRSLVHQNQHRTKHFTEDMAISNTLQADGKLWYSVKNNVQSVCSILEGGIRRDTMAQENGRFGSSEYGPGLYLSKGEVPYAVAAQPIIVFKLVEDLDGGVLTDPVNHLLGLYPASQQEVLDGYDQLLLNNNFIQHGSPVVGDAEEICLRAAKGRMVPVGVYMPNNIVFNQITGDIDLASSQMTSIDDFCRQNNIDLAHDFKPRLVKYLDPNKDTCELRDQEDPHKRIFFKKLRGQINPVALQAEIGASRLASSLIGSEHLIPPATAMTFNGDKGIAQPLVEFRDFNACPKNNRHEVDFARFTPEQRNQFFAHLLVNWVISNHDVHAGNWGIDSNGNVISIDKGQAFKEFMGSKVSSPWALANKPNQLGAERDFIAGNGTFYQAHADNDFSIQRQFLNQLERGEIDIDFGSDIIQETMHRIESLDRSAIRDNMNGYASLQFVGHENDFYDSVVDRAAKVRSQVGRLSAIIRPAMEQQNTAAQRGSGLRIY